MTVSKDNQLLEHLRGRSEQVAEAWHSAISDVGFAALPAAEVRRRLGRLTDQVIELISADSLERRKAREVGSDLAETRMLEPETLGTTLEVLCNELLEELPVEDAALLQRRLAELLPEVAVGFVEQARETVLQEQESIRAALIRDRERIEEALRESEAGLSEAQRVAGLGHWELDFDRDELSWSDQLFRIFGVPREEFGARLDFFRQYVHPADLEMVDRLGRAAIGGEPASFEHRIIRPDGEIRHVHQKVEPAAGEDGRPEKLVGTVQDITLRKQMEDALRESEERFRSAFENASTGMALVSLDGGRSIKVNDALCEVLGYSEEELLQKSFAEFTHPDDLEKSRDRVWRLMAEDGPDAESLEKRYLRKDGREVWVISVVSLVRSASGEPSHFITQVQDITERKLAEERLRVLADAAFEGIVITEHGVVLEVNQALCDILGYRAEEMVGAYGLDFVAPEHREESYRQMVSGSEEPYEVVGLRKDGERRDLEIRGREFSFRGRPARVAVVRDITDRKRIDRELRESNRRLQELAVMKSDFTAMVAHELDSPVVALRGILDMLETGELEAADRSRLVSTMQGETDNLVSLISDVRDAASVEREDFSIDLRRVLVEDLTDEATALGGNLPEGYELDIESSASGEVWADRRRVVQVLRNLLSNAVKYSPGPGGIQLRVTPEKNHVRFELADRGIGIHPDDRQRVFEKFGRGRDAAGQRMSGMGLGLYISRRVVRAHGGDLTLDSTPGEGSVFGFTLERA